MPKTRIKRVTQSYLSNIPEKYYATDENGITTFNFSGNTNVNFKKKLNKKFNQAGKKYRISQVNRSERIDSPTPFNDDIVIDFISSLKNNALLDLPIVKLENKQDFYITSNDYFQSLNEIPASLFPNLRKNMLVSDNLVETPNFIKFQDYEKEGVPKVRSLNQISEHFDEDAFEPYVDIDIYESLDQDFISSTFLYEEEEYDVGNEKSIEIELDFSQSSDAFLLNTQLFYKTNNFFSDLSQNDPLPADDTFVTEQVNILKPSSQESITSHFMPNVIWNNVYKRWEYNSISSTPYFFEDDPWLSASVLNSDLIKISSYSFNKKSLVNYYEFPHFLTDNYIVSNPVHVEEEKETNIRLFKHLNYINNTPICFSAFYDSKNMLLKANKLNYLYNSPVSSYGFINSSAWKTNNDHTIKLENYLPGDFILEKIVFEGKLDIKAEVPNVKGNFVNNDPTYDVPDPDFPNDEYNNLYSTYDAKLFSNNETFYESHSHSKNISDYIASGINFYVSNKIKNENSVEGTENFQIKGYVNKKETNTNPFKNLNFSVEYLNYYSPTYANALASELSDVYIDVLLPDNLTAENVLSRLQNINEQEKIQYSDTEFTFVEPYKLSVYSNLTKDEFNNFKKDIFKPKFLYFEDIDVDNVNLDTKLYFSLKKESIDFNTYLYDTLTQNNISKEIKESSTEVENDHYYNDLITQNSIGFIKFKNSVDQEKYDAKRLNFDVLNILDSSESLFIDVNDYNFKISQNISHNNSKQFIGESDFSVKSNYRYSTDSEDFYFEDSIYIIEESEKLNSNRVIAKKVEASDSTFDLVTANNSRLLNKNIPEYSKVKRGYLLKKSDEIFVGANSFSGFNKIISYARLKNKLKITLIGREVEKKNKNESFESTSITKFFEGNQRKEYFQKLNKNKKYFQKNLTNNNFYVSDSVLPNIVDIFYTLLQKQAITSATKKDALNYYLSIDNYGNISNDAINTTVSRMIFSNNVLGDDSKYSNIVTDWHQKFYLSKFKNTEEVSIKKIKNTGPLLRERGLSELDSFLYLDVDSYSITSKYDKASNYLLDSIFLNSGRSKIENHNIISTINEFILPKEYNVNVTSVSGDPLVSSYENVYYNHSGIRFYSPDSDRYIVSKDDLASFSNVEENKLFSFVTGINAVDASIQYLSIPDVMLLQENNAQSFSTKRKYKDSWALVYENPTLLNGFNFDQYKTNVNITHYDEFVSGSYRYKVMFDNTFKLSAVWTKESHNHNFYIVSEYNFNTSTERVFLVIPLQFAVNDSNESLTINLGEDIMHNYYYDIDFSNQLFNKEDFRLSFSQPYIGYKYSYSKVPYGYSRLFGTGSKDLNLNSIYDFAKNAFSGNGDTIENYIQRIELKYPKNSNLKHYLNDVISDDVFDKQKFILYNVKNKFQFDVLEKKAFALNSEYFNLIDSLYKGTLRKDLFINKIISESSIYKKKHGKFIKTNNKVIYEVFNEKSYLGSPDYNVKSNYYINIIAVRNKKGTYTEDITSQLLYDIKNTDVIRIYDEKLMRYNDKFDMNIEIPYIEIDLSTQNDLLTGFSFTQDAIKYSHYSVNNNTEIAAENDELTTFGSPVAKTTDTDSVNKFLFTYSRNKLYGYPIDQTSGYRYGVHSHTPVNSSYYFNTNHYGQFKDRSYDTQNYAYVENNNATNIETFCVNKNFVNDKFRRITAEEASTRDIFSGSNLDYHERHYHPYIESNDDSDMSYLYT